MKQNHGRLWVSVSALSMAIFVTTASMSALAHDGGGNPFRSLSGQIPEIKHLTVSGASISGNFEIRLTCFAAFEVKAIYAVVVDPDDDADIRYPNIVAFVDAGDEGFFRNWAIHHVDFDPAGGTNGGSLVGHEVLAALQVDHPITIPGPGNLRLFGNVQSTSDSSNDVLNVGALVKTVPDSSCNLGVF